MAAQVRQTNLDRFAADMRRLAGLQGLAYIAARLQRQEEVVVTISGDAKAAIPDTQALDVVEEGHVPSSPTCTPILEPAAFDATNGVEYLIAAYKRYERPMVWCRTRVASQDFTFHNVAYWSGQNDGPHAKGAASNWDYPLYLASCEQWFTDPTSMGFADVLAEVVTTTLSPPPANPLKVDFAALPPASDDAREHLAHLMAVSTLVAFLSGVSPTEGIMVDLSKLRDMYISAVERSPKELLSA